jgi:mono/diheme cytochrome c family protein
MARRISTLAILIAAGFFFACSNPNPQPAGLTAIPSLAPGATLTLVPAIQVASAPTSAVSEQGDPAIGIQVFVRNCSPCHGALAQGVSAPALRDNPFIRSVNDQAVFATIADGRPGTAMPAWLQANGGPLTERQINSVVAFLRTIQNVPMLPTATPLPPEPTETPAPPNAPTPEPARPSNPGGPGPAVTLKGDAARGKPLFGTYCAACHGPEGVMGVPNPDSDDGSVPPLNPIDPTIASQDPKVFATHIDLFIEHGSVPSGPGPEVVMPPFGDLKLLTDQQIADVIAYVMNLNGVK